MFVVNIHILHVNAESHTFPETVLHSTDDGM